jgi:outer membrane receptor protein involved in Fe transport
MRRSCLAVLCLAVLFGLPDFALAQRVTGQIVGTVSDASGAILPGVTVSLKGPAIVGAQTATTNEKGFYRFPALPPGSYSVSFALTGFATLNREAVRAQVGGTTEENASLKLSTMSEEVTVEGGAAVVDTASNQVSTNYNQEWVKNAPTPRYTFFDLINAAPGVAQQSSDNGQRQTSFGSSTNENSYQMDGTDFTAPISGAAWPYPNTDAIEEIEVLSLGAPAEYGNLQGAVFNIVTKQGSNTWHGDLNYYNQNDALTSRNTTPTEECGGDPDCVAAGGAPYHRDSYHDFTAQLSGPIVKDKLWFFGSYQFQKDVFSPVGVPAEFPSLGKQNRIFGKLNWQISAKQKLMFAYHNDYYNLPSLGDANTAPSAVALNYGNNPSPNLTYTATISDKTYIEARYAGFYGHDLGKPNDGSNKVNRRYKDLDTGEITGGIYSWYDGKSNKTGVNAKISHFADSFLGGSHDFKFGIQYNQGGGNYTNGYNDYIYTSGGVPQYGYTQLPFKQNGQMKNVGAFFDDTYRLGEHLTLNLGLRYDHSKASLPDAPVLDAEGNETSTIVPGIDNAFTWNTVSPRLGFAWKLDKSGRSVLKGHYGRYYRGVITGEFDDVAASVSARYLFSGTYDAAGNPNDLELVSDNTNKRVDPNFKNPYTDQFIAQFEQELSKDLAVSFGYVYKRGARYGGWNDVGGQYSTVGYVDDNPDDPHATGQTIPIFQLQNDPADRLFLLTNPSQMFTRYHGGTLILTKRMSHHWQAVASLVLSKSTGRLGSSTQGLKSAQSSSASNFGQNPNDFINTDGRLVGDRPVMGKIQAVYEAPFGFHFGLNFVHQSGRPWSRLVRVGDVVGIPPTILAEPISGDRRAPDWNIFDLSAQKNIKLGPKVELDLFAYLLNLTNSGIYEDVLDRVSTSDTFGLGTSFFPPRRVMLGAHFRF